MAARNKQKRTHQFSLKAKLATYIVALALVLPVLNATAHISDIVPTNEPKTGFIVAASYRNELQDKQEEPRVESVVLSLENKAENPKPTVISAAAVISADASNEAVWDRLAQCESGGNWSVNTGNGYYGGIQFSLGTWKAMGGAGLPSESSREQQIAIAKALQARSGWGQWPACSRSLGLI